ncbi:MAG: PCI domain-containing protein [Anaerolineae bacterium]
MGQGKTIGLILVFIGLVLGLIMTVWLATGLASGALQAGGFVLGLALLAILVLPVIVVGIVLWARGRAEGRELARVAQERRLLNMVMARGQLPVADAAIELNVSRDQVREWIYDLVGKQLFTGYINWNDGILYARDAAVMRSTKCPNCGGEREVVGKGIVRCPYCGSELFL